MSPVVGEVVVVIAVVVALLLTLHTNSKEPNKLSSHCATCPATSTTSSLSPTVVALVSHCKRATVPEGQDFTEAKLYNYPGAYGNTIYAGLNFGV